MATYATVGDLRAYTVDSGVGLPPVDAAGDAQLDRLLVRAERDVDRQLGFYIIDAATGLKFSPAALTVFPMAQRDALRRATCAQAEFRLAQGEDVEGMMIGADDGVAAVGPVSFSRFPVPRIGPKVAEELAGSGLVVWSGTVAA